VFGLVKTATDAHTLGLSNVQRLLQSCGYRVHLGDGDVARAVERIADPEAFAILKTWIVEHGITDLGLSYRLDPDAGVELFGRLVQAIDNDRDLSRDLSHDLSRRGRGPIRNIFFAGLPDACAGIVREHAGRYVTFDGRESDIETLTALGVPASRIPKSLHEASEYDRIRLDFGHRLIAGEKHHEIRPYDGSWYDGYGTERDTLGKRLAHARKAGRTTLYRAHVGPYLPEREKALLLFSEWLAELRNTGFLDIVSIGSSQLSQSHFGRDWNDLPNGGGVPFNSELELHAMSESASPMLLRAYSGTRNVKDYARMLDRTINNAWHALSFWWFNALDGRGPLTVEAGLREHHQALRYIASAGKPFEPNVSHHFAFRGSDDLACIVSAVLVSRLARREGIRLLVLQNMLNTPKVTWGTRDLVKARVLLRLVRELQNRTFRVIYQPRAGLAYFAPDLEKAKAQLAAVSALMCDVEPETTGSPEIVHVVSYSEGSFLATPEVVNDSIRITEVALRSYPGYRERNDLHDLIRGREIMEMEEELYRDCCELLGDIERTIPDVYSPAGFYQVLKRGYLPVPDLWEVRQELQDAVDWRTKPIEGGIYIVDPNGEIMSTDRRLERIAKAGDEAEGGNAG